MPETIEVAVARIDATLVAVQARMADHYAITRESRKEVKESLEAIDTTLKALTKLSDEWAGVRKTIAAASVVIGLLCSVLGAIVSYIRFGAR
ncbi:MAG: hypothetical protein WAN43_16205 [Rhodomicrobium sp.]